MKYDVNKISPNIRALRKKFGKSQRVIATEIGIDFTTFQLIEKGTSKNIQLLTLLKILEYFDITLEELLK